MKTLSLVVLSVILSVTATPLGDRAVFRRHKGVPLSRRHILQSRTDAPAACAALAPPPSTTTTSPDLSSTGVPVDPTAADNSTDTTDPSLASNTTVADPTATDNSTVTADNSTATADNSTATANSTATRRFWSRGFHGSGFHDGLSSFDSSSFSEETSVSISFEETVSTFVETWEDLCLVSGGDIFTNDPCNTLAGDFGIDALSEHADACDQLDISDSMITFAKSHGIRNKDALIKHALSFRAHPRNAVEVLGVIPSSLYCLRAPINPELVGIYNEQIDGVNPGLFGSPSAPLVPFGSSGTCPLDMTADMSSCGCTGSDGTTDSSADDSADSTDDSTDSTDDSADSTDDSTDSTDDSADSTDDSTDSTDSTDSADASDATDATSTDTADASAATDASADATSTDSADASDSTDAATADAVTPPTDTATGANFQPTDISGNVNDPNGRRK
ncbi:hypothetical protein CVT25_009816 [Psilocybe cyanescens]|uniref:Uncharacterized protein n=1 Tax=Psilocybe cyanescens TaxID=93625 RepID=A0A409X868_PSICY|nr:hypothetical protein CVT25_009816 [Psilocybe cyanescens]